VVLVVWDGSKERDKVLACYIYVNRARKWVEDLLGFVVAWEMWGCHRVDQCLDLDATGFELAPPISGLSAPICVYPSIILMVGLMLWATPLALISTCCTLGVARQGPQRKG
jgi:hypothetical protein